MSNITLIHRPLLRNRTGTNAHSILVSLARPLYSFRSFSRTPSSHLRTTELTPPHYSSLKSNPSRLWTDIHATASQFGPGRRYGPSSEETGLSRLTLSDADKGARDWFVSTTRALGCDVTVDSIGNIFAVRRGLRNDVPPTFVGSHLDSQPLGGRFDGALGVCAGIEMLRVLDENWIETEGPVGVVNWTNEEGARFPVSMMGSGVWAGARDLDQIYGLSEVGGGGKTVREELERIGYLGKGNGPGGGAMKMAGHFELHIEQGPKLVTSGRPIGVVKGVQAYKWFEVNVRGRACHTGTTDFDHRADPLHAASEMISSLKGIARKAGGLASVGIIEAKPGSVNTVADHVMFTLDIRHESDSHLDELIQAVFQRANEVVATHNHQAGTMAPPLEIDIKETFQSSATKFDDVAIDCVAKSAEQVTSQTDDVAAPYMVSGAGHDSVNTAKHCPTAMVFVPCKDGVSHHPTEWATEDDCATGTSVVIQSVLRFDKWRYERGFST